MERQALDAVVETLRRLGLGGVTRRHVLIGALLIAVGVVAFAAVSSGGAEEVAVFETEDDDVFPVFQGAEDATAGAAVPRIVVHVAGAVRHPGVYELADGARVHDAIEAAGGTLASAAADALNLARIVGDGERLYIPTSDEVDAGTGEGSASSAGGGASASTAGGSALVDINRADAAALERLPGIGSATAAKIVDDREKNGPFKTVDDLARVSGIGAKKIEALRDLATAG